MKSTDKIAMKITEQEYEDILPTLKENGLVEDKNKWSVENCYLLNHGKFNIEQIYLGSKNFHPQGISLGTLNEYNFCNYKSDYEFLTYNKELFLQYCGINTEETFEQYATRVFPHIHANFLAQKELKNRKPICTTEDGIDVYKGDTVHWVIENGKDIRYLYPVELTTKHKLVIKGSVYKIFSTKENADNWVSNNTPQKTFDGFQIARGENMWVVSTNFYNLHQSIGGNYKKDNGKHLLFKNKVNAINYIILNKTTLSLSDIDFLGYGEERMKLIKKVKEKLGFY